MATDPNISEAVRLAAIKDALSRGGITEKTEVTVTAKAFEQVFEQMETSSLAAFRGEPVEIEPQHEIESSEDALEVEIIDAEEERWPLPEHQTDDERGSPFDSGPQPNPFTGPLGPTGPAGSGLMTLEDAVATQRAITRRATRR
jgi:hypothetical protein